MPAHRPALATDLGTLLRTAADRRHHAVLDLLPETAAQARPASNGCTDSPSCWQPLRAGTSRRAPTPATANA